MELSDTSADDFVVSALRTELMKAVPEIVNSGHGSQFTGNLKRHIKHIEELGCKIGYCPAGINPVNPTIIGFSGLVDFCNII